MSRTKRGTKDAGYEYWSNRPGNKSGAIPGAANKRYTNRAERHNAKKLTRETDDGEQFELGMETRKSEYSQR